MSLDLVALLSGEAVRQAPRPAPGDVVSNLRCPCGTVVALLARRDGETWLWRAPYRHTARGAAEIVLDAALEDFEALAAVEDGDALVVAALFEQGTIDRLSGVLPPLRMPARLRYVTGLAAGLAAEAAGRDEGLAPPRLTHMEAGCGSCRQVLDVGRVVVGLERNGALLQEVVVADLPDLGVERMGYGWPESGRASRVALYRALTEMLTS